MPTWYDSERKLIIAFEELFQSSDIVEIKIVSIYLYKITTINKNLITGELGQITKALKRKINKRIKKIYHL